MPNKARSGQSIRAAGAGKSIPSIRRRPSAICPTPNAALMHHARMTLLKRSAAEAIGTAFLLAAVVGSGIMAERLSAGNQAIALLANTLATGAALACLIAALGPVS